MGIRHFLISANCGQPNFFCIGKNSICMKKSEGRKAGGRKEVLEAQFSCPP